MTDIARPCPRVVPISLCRVPGPLHDALRKYKDGATPAVRLRYSALVVSMLARFLFDHGDCLVEALGSRWDLLTTVPSSKFPGDRPRTRPLATAAVLVPWLAAQHRHVLARGPGQLAHGVATDDGFITKCRVEGSRIVLVEDTYTSGARAQAAASSLQLAGAHVLAILTVARVVDPSYGPHVRDYWRAQTQKPFEFASCCLSGHAGRDHTARAAA